MAKTADSSSANPAATAPTSSNSKDSSAAAPSTTADKPKRRRMTYHERLTQEVPDDEMPDYTDPHGNLTGTAWVKTHKFKSAAYVAGTVGGALFVHDARKRYLYVKERRRRVAAGLPVSYTEAELRIQEKDR